MIQQKLFSWGRLKIWQQWLIHGFCLWALFQLNDSLTYWYRVKTDGPYLFHHLDKTPITLWQRFWDHNYYQLIWVNFLTGALLAEVCYHIVFRKRSFTTFLISIALGSTILTWSHYAWTLKKYGNRIKIEELLGPFLILSVYSLCYALLRDFIKNRVERKNRLIKQSQAELQALKAQVNPHFLFNTLNAIYGTALHEKAGSTAASIEQLADIMRYSTFEASLDFTSTENELRFIENYLKLQRLRLPDTPAIRIDTQIESDDPGLKIAPLLLIPFIENAFKFGIRMDEPSFVTIRLKIAKGSLTLNIQNSLFPTKEDLPGMGTGIANAEKLLELIYPDKHKLSYGPAEGRYTVSLFIQLL